jgi:hypothetical protein
MWRYQQDSVYHFNGESSRETLDFVQSHHKTTLGHPKYCSYQRHEVHCLQLRSIWFSEGILVAIACMLNALRKSFSSTDRHRPLSSTTDNSSHAVSGLPYFEVSTFWTTMISVAKVQVKLVIWLGVSSKNNLRRSSSPWHKSTSSLGLPILAGWSLGPTVPLLNTIVWVWSSNLSTPSSPRAIYCCRRERYHGRK